MVVVVSVVRISGVAADLPGDTVWDTSALLLWHLAADLARNLKWDLPGNLLACLSGNLEWDLSGNLVACLSGNLEWDLPGNLLALLPGDVSASSFSMSSDSVDAVFSGHQGAFGSLDHTLGLDWNLPALTVNLDCTPWSNGNGANGWSNSGNDLGISFGISLALAEVVGTNNTCGVGAKNTCGVGTNNTCGVGTNNTCGVGESSSDHWLSDSWTSNWSHSHLTFNSNQLGLLANLGLDILALVSISGVNNGVGLVVANLFWHLGAPTVGHLSCHWVALPLSHGGAGLVVFGSVLGLGHGVADLVVFGSVGSLDDGVADLVVFGSVGSLDHGITSLVVGLGTLLAIGRFVDGLADWVSSGLVLVRV